MAKILLIEDEQLVADTLELVLLKAGHTVSLAGNGIIGLQKFDQERPDLVITDIIMPQKEGIATIQDLRARSASIPIIAISGGGRTKNFDFLRMADKLGATEILRKPFASSELVAAIERCLRGSER